MFWSVLQNTHNAFGYKNIYIVYVAYAYFVTVNDVLSIQTTSFSSSNVTHNTSTINNTLSLINNTSLNSTSPSINSTANNTLIHTTLPINNGTSLSTNGTSLSTNGTSLSTNGTSPLTNETSLSSNSTSLPSNSTSPSNNSVSTNGTSSSNNSVSTNGTSLPANQTFDESTSSKEDNETTVTLLFAGDISMDKPIRNKNGSSCEYSELITNLTKYFKSVDFNIVNLEAPFVTREMALHQAFPIKGIHNMAWPESVVALTKAGIQSVTLSNNHITDYGSEAALYTQKVLYENNIEVIGLTNGTTPPYLPQKPLIKDIKGLRIAFLAYCGDTRGECTAYRNGVEAGPALLSNTTITEDIQLLKTLKPKVDIIILFLHWGLEYMSIPNEEQRQVAVNLQELGVDVIIGSHPHVMQGHEWINDTLVHYSLGNFVFHPHTTFMGGLSGKSDKEKIHERSIKQSKYSRGPASFTELFKLEITKSGIKKASFLPVRIHVDKSTFCLYPKAEKEDDWHEVCGPTDHNCYFPKHRSPIYGERLDVF